MKLTVLIENTGRDPALAVEHGLSLYVETQRHKLLFDAGQSDGFAANAERLGIDLSQADLAVLSHGHYDHGNGLTHFLDRNAAAPIYLSRHAFGAHYGGTDRFIGLDPSLRESPRLVFVEDALTLDEELSLASCSGLPRAFPVDSAGLNRLEDGQFLPDDFRHEQYLLIREGGRRILISGCSHKGILNIAGWFRPDVLIGGFHFMNLDPDRPGDRKRLEQAAEVLLSLPTRYYTGHCTGEAPFRFLKERMGDRLEALSTGRTLTIV